MRQVAQPLQFGGPVEGRVVVRRPAQPQGGLGGGAAEFLVLELDHDPARPAGRRGDGRGEQGLAAGEQLQLQGGQPDHLARGQALAELILHAGPAGARQPGGEPIAEAGELGGRAAPARAGVELDLQYRVPRPHVGSAERPNATELHGGFRP
jgi:hypothetical protein